jgi:hypothetical protein
MSGSVKEKSMNYRKAIENLNLLDGLRQLARGINPIQNRLDENLEKDKFLKLYNQLNKAHEILNKICHNLGLNPNKEFFANPQSANIIYDKLIKSMESDSHYLKQIPKLTQLILDFFVDRFKELPLAKKIKVDDLKNDFKFLQRAQDLELNQKQMKKELARIEIPKILASAKEIIISTENAIKDSKNFMCSLRFWKKDSCVEAMKKLDQFKRSFEACIEKYKDVNFSEKEVISFKSKFSTVMDTLNQKKEFLNVLNGSTGDNLNTLLKRFDTNIIKPTLDSTPLRNHL